MTLENIENPPFYPCFTLDKGYVQLESFMGSDVEIARAAQIESEPPLVQSELVRGTVRRLAGLGIVEPFSLCEIKLKIKAPAYILKDFCTRVHYVVERPSSIADDVEFQRAGEWRPQPFGDNKFTTEDQRAFDAFESDYFSAVGREYQDRIFFGIDREQAKKDLPESTYSEAYWKSNLLDLFAFLKPRLDRSAKKEIKIYAETIFERIVKPIFPFASEAFEDYFLNAVTLNAMEIDAIKSVVFGAKPNENERAKWIRADELNFRSKMRSYFNVKINENNVYGEIQ